MKFRLFNFSLPIVLIIIILILLSELYSFWGNSTLSSFFEIESFEKVEAYHSLAKGDLITDINNKSLLNDVMQLLKSGKQDDRKQTGVYDHIIFLTFEYKDQNYKISIYKDKDKKISFVHYSTIFFRSSYSVIDVNGTVNRLNTYILENGKNDK